MALQQRFSTTAIPMLDIETAREKSRLDDADGAIDIARSVIDNLLTTGEMIWLGPVPTDPGFVLHELPLLRLRALLARAHGDESGYLEFADRYR